MTTKYNHISIIPWLFGTAIASKLLKKKINPDLIDNGKILNTLLATSDTVCWCLSICELNLSMFSQVAHSDLAHQVNQDHQDHLEEMDLGLNQLMSAITLQNIYRVSCVFVEIGFSTVTDEESSRQKCVNVQVETLSSFWLDLQDHLVLQGFLGFLKMNCLKTWPTELLLTCRV